MCAVSFFTFLIDINYRWKGLFYMINAELSYNSYDVTAERKSLFTDRKDFEKLGIELEGEAIDL